MQKKSLFLIPAVLLVVIVSCKKDPRACASADKTSALTGESVTFTNCSENALRILWDFGDGKSEEGNSVTHSYINAGTYLVNMTAFSKKDKDWDKTSILIAVADLPMAGFWTKDTVVCENEDVAFFDVSKNSPTSWLWTFQGGNPSSSTSQFPVVKYDSSGVYNVTLTVNNLSGSNTITQNGYITVNSCIQKRYLTKIVLKSFSAKNSSNNDWDTAIPFVDGAEPDILVTIKLSNDEWSKSTSTKQDIKATDLPYIWNYPVESIYLTNQNWNVEIRDNDGVSSELMNGWNAINLATISATNGVISLTATNYALDIYFEER